ncbi:MAG: prepilin-type cleavage/methylation domain-containing protein [Methylotenera sp. 24-45-7]|jgi:type IV fimbrial biogenesis protein FimT|nr:MAG: prepilin-type cleavage/methylation domain-containing protein [Mehylophilales bacterium 35-46-6]OYZ39927.1 MAG: prepilin-type cleavage/methylation domain-containing protein [Methylotenera sp. 24-45-7]OZA09065.1 MAG: prepilin-type cleavage/methylation domain-containing protein [Methylotenera sp. 17-45-7]OZA54643.1 MAG: prepilin-type cleavage/methylation domain-containing protein [Methylophilales bacterium 39-45-7]HQS36679.1 GspH/FimT family pseudopilin [Methylotenera sp.]
MKILTKAQGFTLVELMTAIAVLSILLSVALPSFENMLLSGRLRSYANELVASAYLARSEAIKTNSVVRLCASSNGTSCDGSWGQGWVILRSDGAVVQAHGALADGYAINAGATTLSFKATGIGATQTTLTVCKATPSPGNQERVVTISATGRPSVSKTTTGSC